MPDSINGDSSALDFFSLLWDRDLWLLLRTETNRQARHIKNANANNYCAKNFKPTSVNEMKAFFGCRIAMEILLNKDRYAQMINELGI